MKLKIVIASVCISLMLFASPLSAFAALAYSAVAADTTAQSYVGSYAENYVDGNVQFGPAGQYDSVVNSIYLSKDPNNALEVGWSWDRWANGSKTGPYMFTVKVRNGVISSSGSLGAVSKNTWYKWKIQPKQMFGDTYDIYFNSTKAYTWANTGLTYSWVYNAEEHNMTQTRFVTKFRNMQ